MTPLGPGDRIGEYELLCRIGEGGMGVVYIAKHGHQRDFVAVKVGKPELSALVGSAALLSEIANASALQHPHIVRVYTSGTTSDGTPYLVMPLIEGGTLAEPRNRRAFSDPARARALLIQIAGAVEYAHGHLVLHCDLKPDNILIGADGAPHVSDFGLARAIGRAGVALDATIVGGNRDWMSPEQRAQTSGEAVPSSPLTAASDVFSLGVMLRWLLDSPVDRAPAPKSGRHRRLRWELGAIADRATQTDPARRYPSAARLVEDLERSRDDYPIEAERHLPFRRVTKWIRRHRLVTALSVQVLLLLVYFALVPFAVLREVRSTIRQRNEFAALAQAGAVMNELRSLATQIETMAAINEVRDLVGHPDVYAPPPILEERLGTFDSLAVFTVEGTVRARHPRPRSAYARRNFAFRDYSRTLEQLAERPAGSPIRAYVSRVFRSQPDGRLFIGIAAPLLGTDGKPIGMIMGSSLARATFGAVQMNCTGDGDCMTALLGSRDRDGPDEAMPDAVNVLAEPGLVDGEDRTLDKGTSWRLCRALGCVPRVRDQFTLPVRRPVVILEDYRDAVSGRHSLAAAAPVGGTGLVVLVATPDSAADALTRRMLDRMKAFLWIPIVPGLILLTLLFARRRRSKVV
jgi:serine/threonine-protein kinase